MADLAMPIFIGHVIDLMEKEDYDGVSDACLYMIIITIVSVVVILTSHCYKIVAQINL